MHVLGGAEHSQKGQNQSRVFSEEIHVHLWSLNLPIRINGKGTWNCLALLFFIQGRSLQWYVPLSCRECALYYLSLPVYTGSACWCHLPPQWSVLFLRKRKRKAQASLATNVLPELRVKRLNLIPTSELDTTRPESLEKQMHIIMIMPVLGLASNLRVEDVSVQVSAKNFSILCRKCMQITQSSTNYICKWPVK